MDLNLWTVPSELNSLICQTSPRQLLIELTITRTMEKFSVPVLVVYHELLLHTLEQCFNYFYVRGSKTLCHCVPTPLLRQIWRTTIQCHNRGSVGASTQAAEGGPLYFSFIRAKIMTLYDFWGQFHCKYSKVCCVIFIMYNT